MTTASVAAGLNSDRVSELPDVVAPPAKAHSEAIREAHGAVVHPLAPETTWLATTPPPAKVKVEAVLPVGSPAVGSMVAVPRAGTVTVRCTVGTVPPVSAGATVVMDPVTGDRVELVR